MELFSIRKDKCFKKEEKNAIIVIKVSLLRAILKALFIFQWLMFIKGLGTSQVSGKAARGGKDAASGAASASRPLRALGLGLGAGTRLCVSPARAGAWLHSTSCPGSPHDRAAFSS